MRLKFVLPLPHFLLHPVTSGTIAVVHGYLAYGHLTKLIAGEAQWLHIWKGFGALFGAYVFTALTTRQSATSRKGSIAKHNGIEDDSRVFEPQWEKADAVNPR